MLNKKSRVLGLTVVFGVGCLSNISAADSAATPQVTTEMQQLINRHGVGRDAVATDGEALFKEGSRLLIKGRHDDARDAFIKAQQKFEQFNSTEFHNRVAACQQMIKQCYIGKAKEAMRVADEYAQVRDFEEAIKLCEEAIKYCPEEEQALREKVEFYQKRKNAAQIRDSVSKERLLPDLAREQYDIQVLLQQGRELISKGEYTSALNKFEEIMLIDPYHAEAMQNILATNNKIGKIAKARYSTTKRKMTTEVDWKYVIPITPDSDGSVGKDLLLDGPVELPEREETALQKKLESIIIPRIDFEDVTVASAVKHLRDQSRLHDPERIGVTIFLRQPSNALLVEQQAEVGPMGGPEMGMAQQPNANAANPNALNDRITLKATNRPLMEVIAYLCREAKMRYRVEKYAVVLAPTGVAMDDMETRIFPVEQSALSSIPGGGENKEELSNFFIKNGNDVDFPIGSKIVYDTRISRLIVTNTAENLRRIGDVINEMLNQQEPMVQVLVRFIEISQTDLDELAFNYQMQVNTNVSPTGRTVVMDESSNALMRYYTPGEGTGKSDPVGESTFNYRWANSDGTLISASMFALDRADSKDILASPRITTLPGQNAHIEMVIEQYFPDEWEVIDLKQSDKSSGSSGNGGSRRSWRTLRADPQPVYESTPRKLGIMFDIIPQVDLEQRTITAPVSFPIQTLAGWMEYDARTTSGDSTDGDFYHMPIFDTRNINTLITVYDGDTVVLGGVTADQTETIHDKIPILGDLPLVGRLFQSRYTLSEKRNLLIFITCKLVKPDGTPFFPQEERERGVPRFGQNKF